MEYEFHVVVASKGERADWLWEETSLLYGPMKFEKTTWRYGVIAAFIEAGQLPPFPFLNEMFYFRSVGKDIVFYDWETGQPILAIKRVDT